MRTLLAWLFGIADPSRVYVRDLEHCVKMFEAQNLNLALHNSALVASLRDMCAQYSELYVNECATDSRDVSPSEEWNLAQRVLAGDISSVPRPQPLPYGANTL